MEEGAKASVDSQDALRSIRIHWLNHIIHELRGPLFAARGYSKLLLDEKGGPVTATQRKYLETTLDSLDKISSTIDRLHDLKAQEKLELESVDLAGLLGGAVAECRRQQATLPLNLSIAPGPIPTVGDRAKLKDCVHKLLVAMVEFSRSGGQIDLQADREGGELLLRITAARGPEQNQEAPALAGQLAETFQIFRLHGGVASVDSRRPGFLNVTVRLPLLGPETAAVSAGKR